MPFPIWVIVSQFPFDTGQPCKQHHSTGYCRAVDIANQIPVVDKMGTKLAVLHMYMPHFAFYNAPILLYLPPTFGPWAHSPRKGIGEPLTTAGNSHIACMRHSESFSYCVTWLNEYASVSTWCACQNGSFLLHPTRISSYRLSQRDNTIGAQTMQILQCDFEVYTYYVLCIIPSVVCNDSCHGVWRHP